jgi:sugar phosphate isomerase/epimerase
MTTPIALQLYTVREAAGRDYEATIRRVAEIGFAAVEPAGFPGTTPQAAGRLFKELGLTVCAAHSKLPLGDEKNQIIETMQAINCQNLINASQPREKFATRDGVHQVCDLLNEAYAVGAQYGFSVGYHNHEFEFENQLDGRSAHELMVEYLDPGVFFEIDTYWVQTAGLDPATVIKNYGKRAPFLHIKDGSLKRDEPQTALGTGLVDIPAIVAASTGNVDWLVVELDACATDMFEAVEQSYQYLVSKGLGHGKN